MRRWISRPRKSTVAGALITAVSVALGILAFTYDGFTPTDVELNDEGFFVHPEQWTEEMVPDLARGEGIDELTDAHWTMSGLVVLMTLVGGLGTIVGPIVGAIVIIALENKLGDLGAFLARVTSVEWFNTLGDSVTIVTGLIFIVCVLAFRRGIVGEIAARFKPAGRH